MSLEWSQFFIVPKKQIGKYLLWVDQCIEFIKRQDNAGIYKILLNQLILEMQKIFLEIKSFIYVLAVKVSLWAQQKEL